VNELKTPFIKTPAAAGSAQAKAHAVVDFPEGALEGLRCQRFLQRRSLDDERLGHAIRTVRDQPLGPNGAYRRHYHPAG